MTNKKTIDVSEIQSATERLTIGRKLAKQEGPVLFHGRIVTNNEAVKLKEKSADSKTQRSQNDLIHALTLARQGIASKNAKPDELPEPPAGYVAFDPETGACLGFVRYDDEQI